eukprot:c31984_g1_i1 orf=41-217(-)
MIEYKCTYGILFRVIMHGLHLSIGGIDTTAYPHIAYIKSWKEALLEEKILEKVSKDIS